MQLKSAAVLACVAAVCLLAACGQTGALYLPDAGVTTPVEIRTVPAVPAPAPESGQSEGDRQNEDEAPPPAPAPVPQD